MIDPTRQPGIRIAQIFLENAHFEHRPDFLDFPANTSVNVDVNLNLQSGVTADGKRGRVQLTVETKNEGEPLYRFSFLMTALLEAEDEQPNFPIADYVLTNAWGMLFPFVRELVANVTARGRFGALWLKPINVLALAQQASKATAGASLSPG